MSGRKSGEVSSLLSLGKKSKDEINRNLNNNFNQNIKKNNELFSNLEDIEGEIKSINLQLDSQIVDEVSKSELMNVLNRLKIEKEKILNTKLDDFSEELKKKKLIEEEFLSLEKITTELERKIANKSHYCDEEYSEANSVVRRYEEGKKQLNLLLSKILNKMQKNNEILLNTKITYQNIKKLKEEFALKTKNIINANNMALIQDIFESIDKNIAKKFMQSEFGDLEKEYKTLNKDNIESKFFIFKQKLETFSQELLEKYNTFIFKKGRAEKILEELENLKDNFSLNNIEAYIKNKDDFMDMYSFAETYRVNGISREKFEENLKKIKGLMEKEDFDLAYSLTEQTSEILLSEQNSLSKEYERIIKQVEYSKKVAETGKELGYNIKISADENGVQDGINIKLTMGDEIIEFEPRVDDNGNFSLGIDHTESVSGTCGNTMEKIKNSLQSNGIFIADILKNGSSVIYRDRKSVSKSVDRKERSRK